MPGFFTCPSRRMVRLLMTTFIKTLDSRQTKSGLIGVGGSLRHFHSLAEVHSYTVRNNFCVAYNFSQAEFRAFFRSTKTHSIMYHECFCCCCCSLVRTKPKNIIESNHTYCALCAAQRSSISFFRSSILVSSNRFCLWQQNAGPRPTCTANCCCFSRSCEFMMRWWCWLMII